MEQKRIPLAAIKADRNNPRKNFEGLEELAASFDHNKARPGEPYIMPIVTYTGDCYTIVDGERRIRAMKEAGKVVDCLCMVAEGLDDMDVVSMMVATDNKSRLTDDELAQGVQTMMFFGADADTAYDVAGRRRNLPVKALKSVGARIRRRSKPTQLSFKALCDAADVEDDDELNRLIDLSERDEKEFRRELDRTLSRQRIEGIHRRIEDALRKAGVEWVDSVDAAGEDLAYAYRVNYYDSDMDAAVAKALNAANSRGGEYVCVFPPSDEVENYWAVRAEFYVPNHMAESDEERRQREVRERVETCSEDVEAVMRRATDFVFANLGLVSSALNNAMGEDEEAFADEVYGLAVDAVELYHDMPAGAINGVEWSRRFAPLVAAIGYEAYADRIYYASVARLLVDGECADERILGICGMLMRLEEFLGTIGYEADHAEKEIVARIAEALAARQEQEGPSDE